METRASEQARRIAELEAATAGMVSRLLDQALELANLRLEQSRRSSDAVPEGISQVPSLHPEPAHRVRVKLALKPPDRPFLKNRKTSVD